MAASPAASFTAARTRPSATSSQPATATRAAATGTYLTPSHGSATTASTNTTSSTRLPAPRPALAPPPGKRHHGQQEPHQLGRAPGPGQRGDGHRDRQRRRQLGVDL